MSSCVYAMANSDAQAVRIATRLKAAGFTPSDISILHRIAGVRDLGTENSTKAPEGATTGTGTGAILGGPGLAGRRRCAGNSGPGATDCRRADPRGAVGRRGGWKRRRFDRHLMGMGIPEYEAKAYESKLGTGNILMCIHVDDSEEAGLVRQIMLEKTPKIFRRAARRPYPAAKASPGLSSSHRRL